MKTMKLNVGGMRCEGCANAVRTALMQVAGVTAANVDLGSGEATIKASDNVSATDLTAAVENAGYTVA